MWQIKFLCFHEWFFFRNLNVILQTFTDILYEKTSQQNIDFYWFSRFSFFLHRYDLDTKGLFSLFLPKMLTSSRLISELFRSSRRKAAK